ncbi:MAG: hypothetical protein ACREUK_02290 [Burkholderiales bacterium]
MRSRSRRAAAASIRRALAEARRAASWARNWREVRIRSAGWTSLRASLAGLDPAAVLGRGYSITRNAAGEVLRDASGVGDGELISTTLWRGALESRVRKK